MNPDYSHTWVFDNDFPAVQMDSPDQEFVSKSKLEIASKLLRVKGVRGICRVICFSPNHSLTMAQMSVSEIKIIVDTWISEMIKLKDTLNYVQLFENKGAVMGCSNPHPHGQLWATQEIPDEPQKEFNCLKKYKDKNGTCLLCDYVILETTDETRLVYQNDSFICVVPFWAIWPFETLILAKTHKHSLLDFSEKEKIDLADILSIITIKYDNLFKCSFPYSMGIHQAPFHGDAILDSHFHIHFYPPLLRSATVKKFLVGYEFIKFTTRYEMLGEPQRDITAEQAAERLKSLSVIHYSKA
jgi:UDPglucose--hexose-1-phosphate uridylyltransferase